MKRKVTKFTCEITMSDLASSSFLLDVCDDESIVDVKVLKEEDIEIIN